MGDGEKTVKRIFENLLSILPAVLSAAALLTTISAAIDLWWSPKTEYINSLVKAVRIEDINELRLQADISNQKIQELESSIKALSQVPDISKTAVELNRINRSIIEVQNKLSNIERVIVDNPSKALELPFLRKDLESLKESQSTHSLSMKQEIDRVSDLSKLFIAPTITIAVGILALTVNLYIHLYKSKEK